MILEDSSIEKRKYFILEFTKKLIKASSKESFVELETIIEKEQEKKQERIENPLTNKEFSKKIQKKFDPFPRLEKIEKKELKFKPRPITKLIIPEYHLPPTFQYLKPVFRKADIDLQKLNPLIADPLVREIQCNGPEKQIIVKGNMGTKNTAIILTKEDIDFVLESFSTTARIPIHGGVTKIVIGNLVLSAITSEVIESKFIIRKMLPEPIGGRSIYGR